MNNKVFLDDLPKRGTKQIDWSNAVDTYVKAIYNDEEYMIYIKNYDGKTKTLKILWENKEEYIKINYFARCQLGKILGKKTSEFKIELGELPKIDDNDKRDLIITDRKYTVIKDIKYKRYKYKCNKCGFDCGKHYAKGELIEEYWITEGHLMEGNGCACCSNQIVVPHINSIISREDTMWMVNYFQGKTYEEKYDKAKRYTSQSTQKVFLQCCDCKRIKDKPSKIIDLYYNHSITCLCHDGFSFPFKYMYNVLKQLNIEFETEYSPKYLKKNENGKISQKRSDFYLHRYNLVIETDGGLGHKGGRIHSKSNKTIEELVEIDIWKDEQHLKHGVKTIRINCFESDMDYIKNNILKSKLINYFDFSKIDWNKANEFAWFSNLKKEICEYWNNREEWETTVDLAKRFSMDRTTITKYLNKGTELWDWCNYDGKQEQSKNCSSISDYNKKPVEIFKGKVSLGEFTSATDLSNQSKELFGIKLHQTKISAVANRTRPHHKGFTFRYIDQSTNNDQNQV